MVHPLLDDTIRDVRDIDAHSRSQQVHKVHEGSLVRLLLLGHLLSVGHVLEDVSCRETRRVGASVSQTRS